MSSDGNWVTINGVHVLIGGDGKTIMKGPAKFVGKTVNEIKNDKSSDKSSDKSTKNSVGSSLSGSTLSMLNNRYDDWTESGDEIPKSITGKPKNDDELFYTEEFTGTFMENGKFYDYRTEKLLSDEEFNDRVSYANHLLSGGDKLQPTPTKKEIVNKHTKTSEGKDLVPKSDEMTETEIFSELSKKGINSIEDAIEYQGFNELPTVVSSDDFNKYVKDGGIELSRGYMASTPKQGEEYFDDLKYGDFYVAGGEAYFGQGMYCFGGDSLSHASFYSGGEGGRVLRMALPKDAKVLEINGKNGLMSKEVLDTFYKYEDSYSYGKPVKVLKYNKDNRLSQYEDFISSNVYTTSRLLERLGYKVPKEPDSDLIYSDLEKYHSLEKVFAQKIHKIAMNHLRKNLPKEDVKLLIENSKGSGCNNIIACSKGYDAIKLSKEYVNETSSNGYKEIWIVLNRSKLIVEDK